MRKGGGESPVLGRGIFGAISGFFFFFFHDVCICGLVVRLQCIPELIKNVSIQPV